MCTGSPGTAPPPAPAATVAGESPLFVDPAEIPAHEDVTRLGQALAVLHPGYELMALFAAYTGLRWGELAALTITQIDPATRTVTVDRKVIEISGHLYAEPPKGRKRPAGQQVGEQAVQPAAGLVAGAGEFIAAVTQHPQHSQLRIGADLPQALVPQRDHDDRVRVGGAGLAALPGAGDPGTGGEFGRHIQHLFPAGQQPLRERPADPVRSFYGPDPLRPLLGHLQQLVAAAGISAELAGGPQDLPVIPGLDRH